MLIRKFKDPNRSDSEESSESESVNSDDFDCNLGSTDITRMKAKTKTNVNYSNIYKGVTENWTNLTRKRDGNKVKYVHKDIHIGKTNDEPICWPDGEPNDAGDIGELAENFSKELMKNVTKTGLQNG